MTRLFISLYPETNETRKNELKTCLLKNIECTSIDEIFILAEKAELIKYIPDNIEKICVLPVTVRPTFKTFFSAVNNISGDDDINIISNADIYFEYIPVLPQLNQCFALTRYEVGGAFLNRSDSQDTWMIKGKIKPVEYCSMTLGRPGCDNRIAYELRNAGYEISNPSLTIKSYHLHRGDKSYDNTTHRVQTPYLRLNPVSI